MITIKINETFKKKLIEISKSEDFLFFKELLRYTLLTFAVIMILNHDNAEKYFTVDVLTFCFVVGFIVMGIIIGLKTINDFVKFIVRKIKK